MTSVFSLLIALIGVLMYALCSSPKLVEIGRIMFWTACCHFCSGADLPAWCMSCQKVE